MEKILKLFGVKGEQIEQAKQVMEIVKIILPKFEYRNITMEIADSPTKDYAAILFEQNPANKRRVTAIEELFTDILPPFLSLEDFEVEEENQQVNHYAALLFEIPQEKKP